MATSPSEMDDHHANGDLDSLVAAVADAVTDADADEAAAIAVAIGAHLRDGEQAAAAAAATADEDVPAWENRRWSYSGRVGRKHRRIVKIPGNAPADPWVAAGRADRM